MYFDNAATSYPKPDCVPEQMVHYIKNIGASPGRGTYAAALEGDQLLYDTRKAICRLLHISRASNVVFTANSTEAINLAVKGILQPEDCVATTAIEHNAVWRPLKKMEQSHKVHIRTIGVSSDGTLDLAEAKRVLSQGCRLAVFIHGSNVIGNILPVQELTDLAHQYGALVLLDASQTAGAIPMNLTEIGADFAAFTGHKGLMGPTGTGGLYIKDGCVLDTLKEGGTGSMSVSPYSPEDPPDRYEVGTVNIIGIAGLYASVKYISEIGVDKICKQEQQLIKRLMVSLQDVENITLYGPGEKEERLGLLSLNIKDMTPYDAAKILDQKYGMMARAGLHCSPQAHRAIGTIQTGTLRISTGWFNTEAEIDQLAQALMEIAKERV